MSEWTRRIVSFVLSLFVLGIGVSLAIRANLGSSPITCPPYVWSMAPGSPLTMGSYIFCMQFFFVLIQFALLRKNIHKIQVLQLGVCLVFGVFADVGMWLTEPFQWDSSVYGFIVRWVQLALACIILAVGVIWEVKSDILLIPGEGLPLAISKFFKIDFGKVKIGFDVFLVLVAVISCYAIFGEWRWDLVGVGTLFSMFFVGMMVRLITPHMGWLDRMLTRESQSQLQKQDIPSHSDNLVITISREYGSGGHEIGLRLSRQLGIPMYDRQIIDATAKKLGLSDKYVADNEQRATIGQLIEMIFADGTGISPEMALSEEDAIFVTESRLIRGKAAASPCIIIGRCADFILRDNPNCVKVFIRSDADDAVSRAVKEYDIPAEKAKDVIMSINKERATHYWQYTGNKWADSDNYDMVINSSKTGIEGAVSIIKTLVEPYFEKK